MDFGALTFRADGRILLESGDTPHAIRGMESLLQSVIVEMMSDALCETGGGSGFVSALHETPLGSAVTEIGSILKSRLHRVQENIFDYQKDADLSDDERLSSLRLLDVGEGSGGWEADVELVSVGKEIRRQRFS